MTPEHATTWNRAILAAIRQYPNGIGAIKSLQKRVIVTVEHIGTTTKQEVKVEDSRDND